MNTSLEGWKLALMLLIPAALIGAAVWLGIDALSDDSQEVTANDPGQQTPTATATPTQIPQTQPVDQPDPDAPPTPVAIPSEEPTPVNTPTPDPGSVPTATPTPQPTATPNPNPAPSGPTSTPTPDPDEYTVACTAEGGFPTEVGLDEPVKPLSAVVTPAEAAAGMMFSFDYGNGYIASARMTGEYMYPAAGAYTIVLTVTDAAGMVETITCGTVTVGGSTTGDLMVTCAVAPADASRGFEDAQVGEVMVGSVSWTPSLLPLTLQWDFGPFIDVVFSENVVSPVSMSHGWADPNAAFRIFYRDEATGRVGNLVCPAYPESLRSAVVPTATPTPGGGAVVVTATPTPTATPTN